MGPSIKYVTLDGDGVREGVTVVTGEGIQGYSVFLTTTIRRIESGFNNFYYQCPPLLFTSRSRPIYIYIYHRVSRTCDVRHSPTLQSLLFSKAILLSYRHQHCN